MSALGLLVMALTAVFALFMEYCRKENSPWLLVWFAALTLLWLWVLHQSHTAAGAGALLGWVK